jgi:small subunit ribosomal protein S20
LTEILKMAHHQSAKKRIRRNARRAEINRIRLSRVRTYIKAVEAAIASGDKAAAQEALKAAQPEMHRGARVGVMHRNTVARKLSRLSRSVKSLA